VAIGQWRMASAEKHHAKLTASGDN